MENLSPRTHWLREWFASHASWELAKWIAEKTILAAFFAWLASHGLTHVIPSIANATFNVFLILIGISGLVWTLGFIPRKKTDTAKAGRGIALQKLTNLMPTGYRLMNSAPKNSDAQVSDFVTFWSEEIGGWTKQVGSILEEEWNNSARDFFLSTTGLNLAQPVPHVHPEAANMYLRLTRWIQNLDTLRQILAKD